MTDEAEDGNRIQVDPSAAGRVPAREMLLRFSASARASPPSPARSRASAAATPAASCLPSPPSRSPASPSSADKDGLRLARDDARGTLLGTVGLAAFALTVWELMPRMSAWWVLPAAAGAWAVVSGLAYLVTRLLGHGADEPAGDVPGSPDVSGSP
jgi:hypothetical protein